MAKSKKDNKKPSVKVQDLGAKKNPKGGASDIFAKIGDIKGESLDSKYKSSLNISSALSSSALKIK